MRKMVFDVPAEKGGALTILKQFYNDACQSNTDDWIFVVSKIHLEDSKNLKVISYPWIKKSWLHRIYFDLFVAHRLIDKYKAEEVLSLQNLIIPRSRVKQTVYVHQSLPFVDYKFKFRDDPKVWIYKNIIGKMILYSIKKADKVIVQTNWMKNVCINNLGIDENNIEVRKPKMDLRVKKCFIANDESYRTFFYPAGPSYYKNHRIIIRALSILKSKGIDNINVIFTLNGDENKHIKSLSKYCGDNQINVNFLGNLPIEEVYRYYGISVLIFPSYVETIGLPLIEAKIHKAPILVSDCEFSRDILDNYDKSIFFNPFDAEDLANKINNIINNR